MRGEDDAVAGAAPAGLESGECLLLIRVVADGFGDEVGEFADGLLVVDVADLLAQAFGAADAGAVHQAASESFQIVEADLAGFEAAREIKADVDDRIEAGRIGNLRPHGLQFVAQLEFVENRDLRIDGIHAAFLQMGTGQIRLSNLRGGH